MSDSKELAHPKKDMPLHGFVSELSRQLSDVKTTTDESRGIATVSGKKGGKHLSFVIEQSDLGETRTLSAYDELDKKSGYKDEVKRLRKQGLKQKDVALRLGISQSLVSKLENE